MVQLFIGLMTYAGLMPAPQRRAGAASAATKTPKAKTTERRQSGRSGQTDVTAALLARVLNMNHNLKLRAVVESNINWSDAQQAKRIGAEGERRDVSLGDAGSVTIIVDVGGWTCQTNSSPALRKLIKDIEALGRPADHGNQTEVSP